MRETATIQTFTDHRTAIVYFTHVILLRFLLCVVGVTLSFFCLLLILFALTEGLG